MKTKTTTQASIFNAFRFPTREEAMAALDSITHVTVKPLGNGCFRYWANFQDGSTLVIRNKATRQYQAAWWHLFPPSEGSPSWGWHLKLGKGADSYCRELLIKAHPCQLENA